MWRPLYLLLICSLIGTVPAKAQASQPFVVVQEQDGEERYSGSSVIKGAYEYFEDGELCLLASPQSSANIPHAEGSVRLCFSNQDEALKSLQLDKTVQAVDLKKTCGITGKAKVRVTDLVSGQGPARRWFAARLVHVVSRSPHKMVRCNG